jgi:hypothetical protein
VICSHYNINENGLYYAKRGAFASGILKLSYSWRSKNVR